jgi:type II secretory pathway pseudopilin PulG
MTVLELMIVLAIIGLGSMLVKSGFRMITRADMVDNATELAAVIRRASDLAIEHGEMHRVLIDLDKGLYVVEVCRGQSEIKRNEEVRPDAEAVKRAEDKGKERMLGMPQDALSASGDPEEATKRAIAIAGHHIADRQCGPVTDSVTGDSLGKGWGRAIASGKGVKFKEIWVQHRDEGVTKGQIALYFFPTGSAEKSVIYLTDGTETYSILVFGLTGRVEVHDGELRDVNDHMMRNAMGDKDAKREDQQ